MKMRGRLSSKATVQGDIYKSGGGSTVEIIPVYNTGTKIADYSIDGDEGAIYIPNGDNILDMTWTLIAETNGTSQSVSIPSNTKRLVVIARDSNNNKITMIGNESLDNINKILTVMNQSVYILGGYWKDQAGADYGDTSCQINITNNTLIAYSSYRTNYTYVYALS